MSIAYPLMWSHCLIIGDKPWKADPLPDYYEGEHYWKNYKGYDRDTEDWYDEDTFFQHNTDPFMPEFKSQREQQEVVDNDLVVLGLTKSPSEEDIKEAFKIKAKETHPDKGGTCEAFRKVRDSYNNLMNLF